MIYLWMFFALCIVCVNGHIGQVLDTISVVPSFFGMTILAVLIYYPAMRLIGGNELMTRISMFLVPACGLITRFMVGYGRRQWARMAHLGRCSHQYQTWLFTCRVIDVIAQNG